MTGFSAPHRLARVSQFLPALVPDAWRRLVGYLIQAFAAEAAQPLPDPPTRTQMYRALLRLPDPPTR